MTAPPLLARAPIPSLGLALAGCPHCRAVIGIDGAPGLAAALAAHRPTCPAADDVCGGCGCEAKLYPHGNTWRCGDCLGARLFDTLTSPPARPQSPVRAVQTRSRRVEHQAAADAEPAKKAVA